MVTEAVRRGARLVDIRAELDAGELATAPDARARIATMADRRRGARRRRAVLVEPLRERPADSRPARSRDVPDLGAWVPARGRRRRTKGQRARRRDAGGEGARPPRLRRCRFRWTGLGRALLDRALAAAGATSAHVTTQAANVSALRLYKGTGFRVRSGRGGAAALARRGLVTARARDHGGTPIREELLPLQAAIGIHQLAKLERHQRREGELASRYDAALETLPGARLQPRSLPGHEVPRHLYLLLLAPDSLTVGGSATSRSPRATARVSASR